MRPKELGIFMEDKSMSRSITSGSVSCFADSKMHWGKVGSMHVLFLIFLHLFLATA